MRPRGRRLPLPVRRPACHKFFTSTVAGALVGEAWALLRDFAALCSWHPALPLCEIEGGPADRVGYVRVFPLAGGHRETLVSLDDKRRAIAFRFGDNAAGAGNRAKVSSYGTPYQATFARLTMRRRRGSAV
jgi:Polyketide cyclase / dehydrase and lipid transport